MNLSKDLSQYAQSVWAAKTIPNKKQALNELLDNCIFQKNLDVFRKEIAKSTISMNRMDFIASNLLLVDKDKIIK